MRHPILTLVSEVTLAALMVACSPAIACTEPCVPVRITSTNPNLPPDVLVRRPTSWTSIAAQGLNDSKLGPLVAQFNGRSFDKAPAVGSVVRIPSVQEIKNLRSGQFIVVARGQARPILERRSMKDRQASGAARATYLKPNVTSTIDSKDLSSSAAKSSN
jgi:hypothetical protein